MSRFILLALAGLLCGASMVSCTYTMCHPYKLNGFCEYVGSDGLAPRRERGR